ncbi:glycoside hydrolase family 18 [Sphingobacterium paludis]|jgi:hypothetical protein|uniref:mannosyl-glycoprotein endo-beta-N-acetylglucosaminidase n=1 Tax=Sphingobacterium paludis TaxID=1476465 RepID=A0A4R7CT10_9SPHI|nr:glycoside hydrolase family 18 [Sphingobacterium paludis]TDS07556.1 glycosyl hydrolase family 18 (putative chitinase) [Sphingobacterium paludis]
MIKKQLFKHVIKRIAPVLFIPIAFFSSCQKSMLNAEQGVAMENASDGRMAAVNDDPNYLANLIAYKNSPHPLFVGYLVADGNDPVEASSMLNVPDSVDIVVAFAGWDRDPSHWRALQAKGTKILICTFPGIDAFYDGSQKDTTTTQRTSLSANSTYDHWAKAMYDKFIVEMGWDGIDVDIETGTFGGDAPASNARAVLTSISKYFGPNALAGNLTRAGVKPIYIYDTDVDVAGGSLGYNTIYTPFRSNYDYVNFQSYVGGNRRWSGSQVSDLNPLLNAFERNKLIVLTNGDEFIYPNGGEDTPGGDERATRWLWDIANWTRTNNTAGVGAYRMSRDYNHVPTFNSTRQAIQIMNPARN